MRPWISLGISMLVLLISFVGLGAVGFHPAQNFVYYTSIWTGNEKDGVTLRYLGVIPVGYCYIAGNSVQEMKRCVVGPYFVPYGA